ncbi:scavenger receptor cysteine-rich domain-containing protein SCART1-like [Rousettus aegyptiacus]|uniref:scavenger receptor cysteine-rich domain-containing protein SCART1-like n=1 Tax=Rousettus aegyptiacus TaxID=9407 RepID=UPI00168D0C40|nr:scavenger receptor cysteine-rich domain-containing protein SCART1-like [Rousettus aegyptiacus]
MPRASGQDGGDGGGKPPGPQAPGTLVLPSGPLGPGQVVLVLLQPASSLWGGAGGHFPRGLPLRRLFPQDTPRPGWWTDGEHPCAGRLEVRRGLTWGSVCDADLDQATARMVCRELHCGSAVSTPRGARFGPGSGPMWTEAFRCAGDESLLYQCPRGPGRRCGRGRVAGLRCSGGKPGPGPLVATEPCPMLRVVSTVVGALLGVLLLGLLGLLGLWGLRRMQQRDLGSAEVSFGEPTYDDIGELPLAALYEEILEGKDGAPGEEGRAVAMVVVSGVS